MGKPADDPDPSTAQPPSTNVGAAKHDPSNSAAKLKALVDALAQLRARARELRALLSKDALSDCEAEDLASEHLDVCRAIRKLEKARKDLIQTMAATR